MTLHCRQTVVAVRALFVADLYCSATSERDWSSATRTTVRRVSVHPPSPPRTPGTVPRLVTGLRLITRRGVDVDLIPGDPVVALGRLLEVDGEPGRYSVGGRHHHTEARLK